MEKDYNDFEMRSDKQPERAVKTTIQLLYDNGLFDNYADEVLKEFLLIDEVNERRRLDSKEVNGNNVLGWFLFINTFWKKKQRQM